MTSVVIPGLDLVPSLPSRVVTVDLVDMTEGVAVAGAKIDFFLPADLHVPADDKILQAGRVTLTLNASGHGEIRLPAYTDTVRPADWVIGVKKHWAPHPYYIRVPAGSTKISLADIEPVQQVPAGLEHYLPTGVSLNVTEGAVWNGTGSLTGGIINLDLTVPPGGEAWRHATLPNNTDLAGMSGSGIWWINNAANARTMTPELPEPAAGIVTRTEISNNNFELRWQPFIETAPGGEPIPSRTWKYEKFGTRLSGWVTDSATPRRIANGSNLNDLKRPSDNGPWQIYNTNDALTVQNRPLDAGFYLDVKAWNNVAWQVAWPAGAASDLTPMARKYTVLGSAGWSTWVPMVSSGEAASPVDIPQAHMMLKQRNRLGHGGTIGVGDKVAVGLSFDHGFANYRDVLRPHLVRLGLPHSVAVNTSTLGSGENAGVSYPQLQDWALNSGVVLANHARSHADATTDETIRDMILGSLDLLRTNCPKTVIDTYIAPGTSGTGFNGFNNAAGDYSLWWEHVAGRAILANHASVTATLGGDAIPLDGSPVQSMTRIGFDYNSQATGIKNRISALAGTGMGLQIFNHPALIDTGGYITSAQIVGFLEWLADERDAGRIEVLSSSAFAWAVSGSEKRHDLIKGHTWTGGELSFDLSPLFEWVRGYQRQLAVECSAAADVTLSVTDDTGLLDTSITQTVPAGGVARLNFGIPVDSTALTFTATTTTGTLIDHAVYSV